MAHARWHSPPARPQPADGVVDVWRADLAAGGERERALLAPAERERAARFVRAEDGERWATARGILRALLGSCLDADPRGLSFVAGMHGKPLLIGSNGEPGRLRFNLSHSGDVALLAVTLEREVGVDVELPRRTVDAVAIARRVLGDAEAERLRALDEPVRQHEFLRAWVRWEAVLKCRGTGIGAAAASPAESDPWVCELDPGPPAAAALAVERGPCEVRRWRWTDAGM